jgi:Cu/Ag efflux protein CusF
MKKTTMLLLSLIFVFGFTLITSAAESVKAVQISAEKPKVKQITGDIVTLDLNARTLTVKSKRQEVSLSTDDKTIIRLNKEKKTLADLKSGDKIKAKYIHVDGKNIAKSISIKTATTEAIK